MLIHNYYRIKEQLKKCSSFRKEGITLFCSLCFKVQCSHDLPKDNYEETIAQLDWWLDICYTRIVYEQLEDVLLINDEPIPRFPQPKSFDPSKKMDYMVVPALDLPLYCIILSKEGKLIVDSEGKTQENLIVSTWGVPDGIYWGYYVDGNFYSLAAFDTGWKFTKKFNLLSTERPIIKGIGPANLQVNEKIKQYCNGFWYLPCESKHHVFCSLIFRTYYG